MTREEINKKSRITLSKVDYMKLKAIVPEIDDEALDTIEYILDNMAAWRMLMSACSRIMFLDAAVGVRDEHIKVLEQTIERLK